MGKRQNKVKTKGRNYFFKIDWKRVALLSLEKRANYFDSLIDRILKAELVDPVEVRVGEVTFTVSKCDAKVFETAYMEYEKTLDRLDIKGESFIGKAKALLKKLNAQAKSLGQSKVKNFKTMNGLRGYKTVRNGAAVLLSGVLFTNAYMMYIKNNRVNVNLDFFEDISASITDVNREEEVLAAYDQMEKGIPVKSFSSLAREMEEEEARRQAYEEKIKEEQERRAALIDSYIEEYCLYFNLKYDVVRDIARSVSQDYSVDLSDFISEEDYYHIDFNDDELSTMIFVYELQRNRGKLTISLDDFGLNKKDLKVDDSIYGQREKGEELVLRNGETGADFLARICGLIGADKNRILSVVAFESNDHGMFNSTMCRRKNNFGGMRSNGEYFTFPSPEAGIIAYCLNLHSYTKYNLTNWKDFCGIYTLGHRIKDEELMIEQYSQKEEPWERWIRSVKWFYKDICENPEKYYRAEENVMKDPLSDIDEFSLTMKPKQ